MFRSICSLFVLLFISSALGQLDYHQDILNIKINSGVTFTQASRVERGISTVLTGIQEIDQLNLNYKCVEVTQKFPNEKDFELDSWYTFRFSDSQSIDEIKSAYSQLKDVQIVEFYPIAQTGLLPNDSLISIENGSPAYWHMNLPQAWEIQTGSSSVIVAVIDNGLDLRHPDFRKENICQNTSGGTYDYGEDYDRDGVTLILQSGQIVFDPGDVNGIDDDLNGKIDDLAGWNIISNNNNIYPTGLNKDNQHGNAITGIIAATGNNIEGNAGVAFNSKVLHIKAGDNGSIGGDWISAIQYAADEGAKVINMSFFNFTYSALAQSVINNVFYNKNCVVVACAGHVPNGVTCPIISQTYPASYENVISASVLDGEGVKMRSITRVCDSIDVLGSQGLRYPWYDGTNYSYGYSVSTSGTTAMTSGLAALLLSQYPTWSNEKIINQIFATCSSRDDYNRVSSNTCNFDFYNKIGHGQIDAYKALTFNGHITENLIWNKSIKLYNDITVDSNVTLTIRENTKLYFQDNRTMFVYGTLRILGNLEINTNIEMKPGSNLILEPGAVVNFTNNSILPAILSSSTGWFGNYTLTGNLTIPSGITLKVFPQSKISVTNNSNITTNGTLEIEGCTLGDGINTWGNLIFDGTSASNSFIRNSTIKKSNEIRCLNGANILVQNSLLDNCYHGIYLYNSEPRILDNEIIDPYGNGIYGEANGKYPVIGNNIIKKISRNQYQYQGIYLTNYTNPYIYGNDIQYFNSGIYYGGGGSGNLTEANFNTPDRNNRLINNSRGCVVAWGGYLLGGEAGSGRGINNSIYDNTLDAYVYQQGYFMADMNWWGIGSPTTSVATGGVIYIEAILTQDPWEGSAALEEGNILSLSSIEGFRDIALGLDFEKVGNFESAVNHYKQMILNNNYSRLALSRLVGLSKKYSINVKDYLEGLVKSDHKEKISILHLLAGFDLDENKYIEAMDIYDQIIDADPNGYNGFIAQLEKFYATLHVKKNTDLATQMLSDLENTDSDDDDYLMIIDVARNQLANSISTELPKTSGIHKEQINYSLEQNYPNPFNPTTTIKYSVQNPGLVQIKIYDILGNEIAKLVDEKKEMGKYEVNFNSKHLTSGVYIYTISVNNFTQSRKMLLLK